MLDGRVGARPDEGVPTDFGVILERPRAYWLGLHKIAEADLLGRITGEGSTTDADDIVYTYGTGTYSKGTLTSIDHGSGLWGTQELSYSYDRHRRLKYETYPTGRRIEFAYDAGGRVESIKDPFGFISSLAYDSEGRLSTLTHSTLGEARFEYAADDSLTTIVTGNDAYTLYAYDAYKRLEEFDIKESDGDRLAKHEWGFDDLGRKGDVTTTIPSASGVSALDVTYDSGARRIRSSPAPRSTRSSARSPGDEGGRVLGRDGGIQPLVAPLQRPRRRARPAEAGAGGGGTGFADASPFTLRSGAVESGGSRLSHPRRSTPLVVVPDRPWPSLPPPPPPRVPTRSVWATAPIPTTRSCSTGSPAT